MFPASLRDGHFNPCTMSRRSESAKRGAQPDLLRMDPASKRPHFAFRAAVSSKIRLSASRSRSLALPPSIKLPPTPAIALRFARRNPQRPRKKKKGLIKPNTRWVPGREAFSIEGLRISYSCVTANLFVFVTALCTVCSARSLNLTQQHQLGLSRWTTTRLPLLTTPLGELRRLIPSFFVHATRKHTNFDH